MFLKSFVSGFADIRSISEGVHELYSDFGDPGVLGDRCYPKGPNTSGNLKM